MANFTESIPGIISALGEPSRPSRPILEDGTEPGTFPAIAMAFLARSGDERAVRAALNALRHNEWIKPRDLAKTDPVEVEEAFRASGAVSLVKSARLLRKLAKWFVDTFGDNEVAGPSIATESIRDDLRSINGIGPPTADAILLHGFGRATYPVDHPTYRILLRHGWIDESTDYDEARALIEAAFPDDPESLSKLSTHFKELGRLTCRATSAKCDRCPLKPFLPEGGPFGEF